MEMEEEDGSVLEEVNGGKQRTYVILLAIKIKQNKDGTISNYTNNIYVIRNQDSENRSDSKVNGWG